METRLCSSSQVRPAITPWHCSATYLVVPLYTLNPCVWSDTLASLIIDSGNFVIAVKVTGSVEIESQVCSDEISQLFARMQGVP
jgi:hypothetical protein